MGTIDRPKVRQAGARFTYKRDEIAVQIMIAFAHGKPTDAPLDQEKVIAADAALTARVWADAILEELK